MTQGDRCFSSGCEPNGTGGRTVKTYEFVTFEGKDLIKFWFKGKDW